MQKLLTTGALLVALTVVTVSSAAAQAPPEGKAPYLEFCKKCHGVLGRPPKTMKKKYPDIATFDAAFITARSVDSIVVVLEVGVGKDMKSFTEKMAPAELRAVAEYVRFLGTKE